MRVFTIVWAGQLVSLIGTGMTQFALGIWAWEETGKATALTLVFFFFLVPNLLFSPFAGALVDRSNRKRVMMISDLAAGLSSIVIFLLLAAGELEIWHLYVSAAWTGLFESFQWPAYSAAISTMLPKEQYGRAYGMMSLAESGSRILAPIFAGALLSVAAIENILLIDVMTFTAAILVLLAVHIPQPEVSAEGQAGQGSLLSEAAYGFRYIKARPSLLGLQLVFTGFNFVAAFSLPLLTPLILARTGKDELMLATVQSIGAVGGVLGGMVLSVWGGPKRRVHGVLGGMILVSLFGQLPLGLSRTIFLWAFGSFIQAFILPFLNGSNQAIWQAKVPPDLQGRVFSVRRFIAQFSFPLGLVLAGPLADQVFEPAMRPDGSLAERFGWLVGTGAGAGIGLMFVIFGLLGAGVGLMGYAFPHIRNVETIMPDYHVSEKTELPVMAEATAT
ncbi:MAG: MFS transporter [Anaerolineae bacterium]|nr:MFS transporter [Anaerolineae bacterium]